MCTRVKKENGRADGDKDGDERPARLSTSCSSSNQLSNTLKPGATNTKKNKTTNKQACMQHRCNCHEMEFLKKIHIYYFMLHKEKVLDQVSIVEQKVDLTGLTHFKALIKKYVRPSGTPDYRKLHLCRWNSLIRHPEMSVHDAAVCILQASPLRFTHLFSCSIAVWPLDATKSCLLTF